MTKKDLIKYIEEHWDIDDCEVSKAITNMDMIRCPLSMASPFLDGYIAELVGEFLSDNSLADDWFDNLYGSYEELFWELEFLDK